MSTVKQEVVDFVQALPDDCTFGDIVAKLRLKQLVTEAEEDIRAGRVVDSDEAKRRFEQWLKSSGLSEQ